MDNNGEVVYLYLDDIIPNRFQPREVFDDQALKELAVSIKEHGVIQPIIVRKVENKYEIIAGERRYKASTMAGLTKIPAIIKNLDDKESSKVALIENLQRKDLSPIEEARTYQKILELEDNMTQEQLAATMGKTQSSVSNKLRLLELPDEIQDALLKEKISERHARSLLSLDDKNEQIKMMDKVIAEKMTVRDLDKEIKTIKGEDDVPTQEINPSVDAAVETQSLLGVSPIEKLEESTTNNQPESSPVAPQESPVSSELEPNPTLVDIDKIRETSTDINQINNNPTMDNNVVEETTAVQNEFKFVPTLDEIKPVQETEAPQFNFSQFFNSNGEEQNTQPISENNSINNGPDGNVASAMPSSEISVPSVLPTKDVNQAVTDIKNTITTLQNDGYNVSFEENNGPIEYKISIIINKN